MLDLAQQGHQMHPLRQPGGLLTVTAGGNTASSCIQTAGCFAQDRAAMALLLQLHFVKNECSGVCGGGGGWAAGRRRREGPESWSQI